MEQQIIFDDSIGAKPKMLEEENLCKYKEKYDAKYISVFAIPCNYCKEFNLLYSNPNINVERENECLFTLDINNEIVMYVYIKINGSSFQYYYKKMDENTYNNMINNDGVNLGKIDKKNILELINTVEKTE